MQWTWVWVSSGSWWWTGRLGVLQSMGSQRVKHDWATELNWSYETRSIRSKENTDKRAGPKTEPWRRLIFRDLVKERTGGGPATKRGAPKVGRIRLTMCLKFTEETFSRRESSTMSTALKKPIGRKRENWQLTDMVSITGGLNSCYKICYTGMVWIKAPFRWVKENESKTANIGNSLQ